MSSFPSCILAVVVYLTILPAPAEAGRLSPFPPNRITVHEKEFDALSAFMRKRGFEADAWMTEPCAAPEFKGFCKVYAPDSTAEVLVMITAAGELQAKFVVAAQKKFKEQIDADFDTISRELRKRRYSPKTRTPPAE